MAGDGSVAPKIESFRCSGCGAPLTVRGFGQTETIACESCGAIVDLADENLRVISVARSKLRIEPLIPLGARGTLLGEKLEVIGYMRRRVVVEGVPYEWGEYLLFNPYKGFRWLNEYNGHWTYIRTLIERPDVSSGEPRYLERSFQHFQSSRAEVTYVVGEFFWRVSVGETALVEDYVAPPYLLSRETTDKEIVWSLGQYMERSVVEKTFGKPLPHAVGVAPCQPRPYREATSRIVRTALWLCFAVIACQLFATALSRNELVYKGNFNYHPLDVEKSFVTDVFELRGHASNVLVKSHADVSNGWLYLNMALIDESTGHAYDFGREVSFYSGRDSDGAWTEGSTDDSAVIPAVPSGRYYLRVEPEAEKTPIAYTIEVRRDVPQWVWVPFSLVAIAIVPAFFGWMAYSFERKRWAESDHPMIGTSSDDD